MLLVHADRRYFDLDRGVVAPAAAHLSDGLALSNYILDTAGSTRSPWAMATSCEASHCSASRLREKCRVLVVGAPRCPPRGCRKERIPIGG